MYKFCIFLILSFSLFLSQQYGLKDGRQIGSEMSIDFTPDLSGDDKDYWGRLIVIHNNQDNRNICMAFDAPN